MTANTLLHALISVRGRTKRAPGVTARDLVDVARLQGDIHVLSGENGAGKSTLTSILAGTHHLASGDIFDRGAPVHLRSVRDAPSAASQPSSRNSAWSRR